MLYTVVLVSMLVFLAGVISYTADVLGTAVGKRRLSLFGARPKRSGRIIGVIAGILIMVVTLLVLALAFRNATYVLFNSQQVQEQNAQLRAQERSLADAVSRLETQVAAQRNEVVQARREVQAAESSRREALKEREEILQQQDSLQSEVDDLDNEVRTLSEARNEAIDQVGQLQNAINKLEVEANELEAQNENLSEENANLLKIQDELDTINSQQLEQITSKNSELSELRNEVARLQEQVQQQASALELARQGQVAEENLAYTANQAMHTGVIDAQDTTEIRTQLAQLLATAEDKVLQRRASGLDISTEQLNMLVQSLVTTPGADVVTLRSPENQFIDERVQVGIEVTENEMIVAGGELIATRQLHLGSPELQEQRNSVRTELGQLFSSASGQLLSQGLADDIYPVTSETSLEIEGFTNQLLRLSGPVVVGLTAGDDIYTGGPAKLEFVILN